ncbi:MAG: HEPN domain-containing protein [Solirubrobacteraceae bacterium]
MKANEHDLALELMYRAEEDLSTVQAMLGVAPIADAVVGLHAQQAVERALKAVLAAGQLEYPFTHDIDALAELCEAAGSTLPSELDEADLLTPYAVAARYDQTPQATVQREEAERFANVAVTWARQVVEGELSGAEPSESP